MVHSCTVDVNFPGGGGAAAAAVAAAAAAGGHDDDDRRAATGGVMLLLCNDERKANPEGGGRLGRGASGCCRVSHDMASARLTRPRLRAMGYGLLLG